MIKPLGHQVEYLLLCAVRLLHLDYVAYYVLSVLHVHLEHLDGLALSLHLLNHLGVDYLLESVTPVVWLLLLRLLLRLWDHSIQKYLDDYQEVLVSKEHQVLEGGVDALLGCRVNVGASMG